MIINIADHILFEDECILVIDKPASLMVEPDRNGYPNLLQQVQKYLRSRTNSKEVYVQHLHRLDRPVSGVVLFTKRRDMLRNLSEQFAQRTVKKFYHALTKATPSASSGKLSHWLRKEKKKAMLYGEPILGAEIAELSYDTQKVSDGVLWKIELHTGRYHQIRAQLASTGCPIIGDALYGSTEVYRQDAIALHASKLIFTHPADGKEMIIESKKTAW